jgi:type III pantothenate kinase
MSAAQQVGLLAIDVGTSRVKLGWFPDPTACESDKPSQLPIAAPLLPEPKEMFDCSHRDQSKLEFAEQLASWLAQFVDHKPHAVIASVNPPAAVVVADTLKLCGFATPRILQTSELPIELAVNEPEKLGIDRALAAVAVNRIRSANTPAIVISLGTACTVNLISADSTFRGGAILPGFAMSARALHEGTSSLPLIARDGLQLPRDAVGKTTVDSISAGLYWGIAGAIERLIHEQSRSLPSAPQLFLTGGDVSVLFDAFQTADRSVRVVPHLVLAGIAVACEGKP